VRVTEAAAAAARDHDRITWPDEIGGEAVSRAHLGAGWNGYVQIIARLAVLAGTTSSATTLRAEVTPTVELEQR
jgi:hypothetical protein